MGQAATADTLGALHGVRVVDLTRNLSGPYATMMLADHGADVLKVEPIEGDVTRAAGPFLEGADGNGLGGYFQSVNRNKRSIAVNFNEAAGIGVLLEIIARADIVVSNFRPGVMERLGLDYQALSARNPAVVAAYINGFGDDPEAVSPYRDWPAYDIIAQAMGGLAATTGEPASGATKVGPAIGDIFPGSLLAFGILAALRQAERTGRGQTIEVSMVDAITALCERSIYRYTYTGEVERAEGQVHGIVAPFGLFAARDGWVAIACHTDRHFALLSSALGQREWLADERLADAKGRSTHRRLVNDLVSSQLARFTQAELIKLLGGHVPFGPVQTSREIVHSPHTTARGMLAEVDEPGSCAAGRVVNTPIRFSDTPGGVRRRAPLLGEHTGEALQAIGYSSHAIDDLAARGVVGLSHVAHGAGVATIVGAINHD